MHIRLSGSQVVIVLLLLVIYGGILISLLLNSRTNHEKYKESLHAYQLELALKNQEIEDIKVIKQAESIIKHEEFISSAKEIVTNIPALQSPIISTISYVGHKNGVIILGMHRSGTSIIGGLINKMGLNAGGPLIRPAEDNEKGFFERIDVVLQNDLFMQRQHIHYALNTDKYNAIEGLKTAFGNDGNDFKEGQRALHFLNNIENYPYMLKDPRLCITLRTWLPLLNTIPAILFTYRHPLDVALSLHKREQEQFRILRGLKLWYVYNRRAILQSNDLCRVVASHRKVMKEPKQELDRIYEELHVCGLHIPQKVSEEDIKTFIVVKLQHGRSGLIDDSCSHDISTLLPPNTWQTTDPNELRIYRASMRAFCGMLSGEAFLSTFSWNHDITDA